MKNKGFTLIELLAVLTVLSIILLITVFSVSSVIKNSKNNLHDTQLEQVLKAAEYYNSKEGTDDSVQNVSVKTLAEKGYLKDDEVKDPKTGKTIKGFVLIKYNGKKYSYKYREENICVTAASDVSTTLGTEYECEVKEGNKLKFYVLSTEDEGENQKINLILDGNICEDGRIDKNDSCKYHWNDEENNNKGPIVAMSKLHSATKEWTNIPDMIMNFTATDNLDSNNGYNGIFTDNSTKQTVIVAKDGIDEYVLTDGVKPLKTRLVTYSEIRNISSWCVGIDREGDTDCPAWIAAYSFWSLIGMNSNYANNIPGLPSGISISSNVGIRPVITVPIAFLSANSNN